MLNFTWSKIMFLSKQSVDLVPTSAGVYVIWGKLMSGEWKTVYVGKASNLKQRLNYHLSPFETNIELKNFIADCETYFNWIKVDLPFQRSGIKLYLYDKLTPMFNQVRPSGSLPIQINLPIEINHLIPLFFKVNQ